MRLLLTFSLAALCAFGSRVVDTMYTASGARANGLCVLTWPNFTTATGKPVVGGTLAVIVNNGVFDADIEPTDGGAPVNTTYTVRCTLRGQTPAPAEQWRVPNSTAPLTIAGVRVPVPAVSGNGPSAVFRYNEAPAGLVNGGNRVYTLAQMPVDGSEQVYRNGVRMRRGLDYTIAGATMTFVLDQTPQVGDVLTADYLVSAVLGSPGPLSAAPSSSTSWCAPGSMAYSTNWVYICVAPNTWRRGSIGNW